MRRRVTEQLEAWASSEHRKPLVVFGARQVGKTTSVLEFGRGHYADVVHVDFFRQPEAKAAFSGNLEAERVVATLGAIARRDIVPGRTLLFLDEVQECDGAITALKYLREGAHELDVIAAGSLLGVHVARSASFPVGNVDMLTMHPMDFEEYCWAVGEERAYGLARASFAGLAECPLHGRLMEAYRDYLMVGGMPEAVSSWASGAGMARVRSLQRDISTAYVADMAKYATAADSAKIVACWESVPSQLAKETDSTKFSWRLVAPGARSSRYGGAVDWLVAAGVVSRCTQVTDGASPLRSFENPSAFKLYLADTGMLSCAYDATPADLGGTDHRSARFRGGLAENYVMQQLVARGVAPHYWGAQSRGEVEFVASSAGRVVPVEVKSGVRVRSESAMAFARKYGTEPVVRVSAKNFGSGDGVRSVPLYAAPLLAEAIARGLPDGAAWAGRQA